MSAVHAWRRVGVRRGVKRAIYGACVDALWDIGWSVHGFSCCPRKVSPALAFSNTYPGRGRRGEERPPLAVAMESNPPLSPLEKKKKTLLPVLPGSTLRGSRARGPAQKGYDEHVQRLRATRPSKLRQPRVTVKRPSPLQQSRTLDKTFNRLYEEGRHRQTKIALWEKQKAARPPSECTFNPRIHGQEDVSRSPMRPMELARASLTSMLNAVADVNGDGDRALLVEAYKTNMVQMNTDRALMLRKKGRRNQDTFQKLYEDGARGRARKDRNASKHGKPRDCTFKPQTLKGSRHQSGRQTPHYVAKTGKASNGEKKSRFDYLYEAKAAEREEKRRALKEALRKREELNALPAITPPSGETRNDNLPAKPTAGRPNRRYNKEEHRERVERLKYLKQKNECTFRPGVNKSRRAAEDQEGKEDIVTRLLKEGKLRKERMEKRLKTKSTGCTFRPQINKRPAAAKDESNAKPLYERLYEDGTVSLKKRVERHQNRALPKFEPDLSPSKQYFEKHWYSKEGADKPRPVKVKSPRLPPKPLRAVPPNALEPANLPKLLKALKKAFACVDRKNIGAIPKKKLLKALTFDDTLNAILERSPALHPLRQPRHVNAILSVVKLTDPTVVSQHEWLSVGKMLFNLHERKRLANGRPKTKIGRDDFAPVRRQVKQAKQPQKASSPGTSNPDKTPRKDIADDEGPDGHLKDILCTAIALHDFRAKHPNELTFGEGTMIGVTEMDNDDGWWHGKLESGEWGAFPYTYVHCILDYKDDSFMLDTETNGIFPMPDEDGEEPQLYGTIDLATNEVTRTDAQGEQTIERWKGAKLFKLDWEQQGVDRLG